jgi:hypothetical protein
MARAGMPPRHLRRASCGTLLVGSLGRTKVSAAWSKRLWAHMQNPLTFSLLSWSFQPRALVLADKDDASTGLHQGAKPSIEGLNLAYIPVSLRRRCSPFSRATLAVAYAAAKGDGAEDICMPAVFASAHGESEITEQLLREIALEQQLSPMGFSLSVHNAASGLFSIATGNKAPASAIAANEDTFIMGLCEAVLQLSQQGHDRVLYVCSDDRVPDVFMAAPEVQGVPHALALLIARPSESRGPVVVCGLERRAEPGDSGSADAPLACARWLAAGASQPLHLRSAQGVWRLEAGADPAGLFCPAGKEQGA